MQFERRGRRLGALFVGAGFHARRFCCDFAERVFGCSLLVGANCVRPPACHSEPIGEESHIGSFYFVLLEILRFAQDDKSQFLAAVAFYPIACTEL